MVRLTSLLLRVPVIKFRKNGVGKSGGPPVAENVGAVSVCAKDLRNIHVIWRYGFGETIIDQLVFINRLNLLRL